MLYNENKFALSNPVALMLDKDKNDFTRDDLIRLFQENQLERITFHYTGIDGKIKELKIPIANKKQAETILSEGERVDGSSLFKGIVDTGKSDLYVVPVYKTAFLNPFEDGSLDFICRFIDADGNLASFTPDSILQRAHKLLFDKTGFELYALGELEFYIIYDTIYKTYPLPKQRGYHASSPFVKNQDILNEMIRYITQLCGNVKYAHNEVGCIEKLESHLEEIKGKSAEQVEIEFLPTNIEETAEYLVLSKWIIRNVAYKHNSIATFVPKLENGHAGNGMHIHMQLMKDGKNIMTNKKGNLSEEAKMLIGGLCQFAPSLTAFGNTCSASYLRLVPHQEAPTKVCWSESNRSAMIRVPLGWTKANNLAMIINPQQKTKLKQDTSRQTVELRTPDGSALIHLLLSGIVLAVDSGLTNSKESLETAKICHVSVNIHDSDYGQNLSELPTSCAESSEKLLQHRSLYERDHIFSSTIISYITNLLQNENDRNLNKRLMALPDDEKLKESRRIMHRDIHKH